MINQGWHHPLLLLPGIATIQQKLHFHFPNVTETRNWENTGRTLCTADRTWGPQFQSSRPLVCGWVRCRRSSLDSQHLCVQVQLWAGLVWSAVISRGKGETTCLPWWTRCLSWPRRICWDSFTVIKMRCPSWKSRYPSWDSLTTKTWFRRTAMRWANRVCSRAPRPNLRNEHFVRRGDGHSGSFFIFIYRDCCFGLAKQPGALD